MKIPELSKLVSDIQRSRIENSAFVTQAVHDYYKKLLQIGAIRDVVIEKPKNDSVIREVLFKNLNKIAKPELLELAKDAGNNLKGDETNQQLMDLIRGDK